MVIHDSTTVGATSCILRVRLLGLQGYMMCYHDNILDCDPLWLAWGLVGATALTSLTWVTYWSSSALFEPGPKRRFGIWGSNSNSKVQSLNSGLRVWNPL